MIPSSIDPNKVCIRCYDNSGLWKDYGPDGTIRERGTTISPIALCTQKFIQSSIRMDRPILSIVTLFNDVWIYYEE